MIQIYLFVISLLLILSCVPPFDFKQMIYPRIVETEKEEIRLLQTKSASVYALSRKHLLIIGLLADIVYDITYMAPLIVCYCNPKLLLRRRWQETFERFMSNWDWMRFITFATFYFIIDLIGLVY